VALTRTESGWRLLRQSQASGATCDYLLKVRLSLQLLAVDDLGAELTTGEADVSFGRVLTLNVLNRV
jgi:hypothetical protein